MAWSGRWGLVVAAAATALAPAASRGDEPRRIATLAPDGSPWMRILERGAAEVERRTGGRIKTKFYAGGSQGDERDVVRKMRLGQLDGAALTSIGLGMIYPGIRVLELPFLFESTGEIDYVRAKMWPHFREQFAQRGFELLIPGDVGWIHVFTKRPIRTAADLQRLKMWAWTDDPIVRRLFKAMGLDGVPMGVPAVLPALQAGRIDAAYGSALAAVALQWHTQVSYMIDQPVGYGLGAMVMRTDVWNRASPADRAVQVEVAASLARESIARTRRDNRRALAAMRKNGLAVVPAPADVAARLRQAAVALREQLVGEVYTAEELAMALRYRDEYRAARAARAADR